MAVASVCGLGIQVDVPIPELSGLGTSPRVDVRVSLGTLPSEVLAEPRSEGKALDIESSFVGDVATRRAWRVCGGRYLRIEYGDGTTVVVDEGGQRLWATWPASSTLEDTATYVFGPILGLVLRLRGITCLHASAFALGDRAIALVGPAGHGKSSTAASFAKMGFPILSDDIVALRTENGEFVAEPALPRLKLWPDSSESLFGNADALPCITAGWDKRYLALGSADFKFQQKPLPLGAIYFLEARDADLAQHLISPIGPRDALMSLVANAHGSQLAGAQHRERELDVLARVVGRVSLRRVQPRDDPALIPELCEAILRDIECTT